MATKGLNNVIMCVLILGLVLEHVQVEGKSCCKSTTARNCYNVCRLKGSQPFCANLCGCKIIKGNKCPSDFPKLDLLRNAGEPDAIQYCILGCKSSVCDTMNDVFIGEEMKIDMERCSDECDRFCDGSARMALSVAA